MVGSKRPDLHLHSGPWDQRARGHERAVGRLDSARACSQVDPHFAQTSHAEESKAQTTLWPDGWNSGYSFLANDFVAGQWKAQTHRLKALAETHGDDPISSLPAQAASSCDCSLRSRSRR